VDVFNDSKESAYPDKVSDTWFPCSSGPASDCICGDTDFVSEFLLQDVVVFEFVLEPNSEVFVFHSVILEW
jgi:hypothetical protein